MRIAMPHVSRLAEDLMVGELQMWICEATNANQFCTLVPPSLLA